MFKTILAATDRVTARDAAVMVAINLAAHYGADLHILHVLESQWITDRGRNRHNRRGVAQTAPASYQAEALAHLQTTYAASRESSPRFWVDTTTRLPWLAILIRARRIGSDLIITGPHRRPADGRSVLQAARSIGSTVEGIMMRAPCPVMIVNRRLAPGPAVFQRILVGVDFSAACECALCFAVKLASAACGAHIHVFHMLPVPPYPKYSRIDYETDRDATQRRLGAFGEAYLDGTAHTHHVWGGVFPHDELLQCASKVNADLIILGSHTKEQDGKWYPGSVVERVGLGATCPVMALSAPEALQPWQDVVGALRSRNHASVDRRLCVFNTRSRR